MFQIHSTAYFPSTQPSSSPPDQLPLRAASKFPRIPTRTKKYQSFLSCALANYQTSPNHYDCIALDVDVAVALRAQADASMPASNNNVNSHYILYFLTAM